MIENVEINQNKIFEEQAMKEIILRIIDSKQGIITIPSVIANLK